MFLKRKNPDYAFDPFLQQEKIEGNTRKSEQVLAYIIDEKTSTSLQKLSKYYWRQSIKFAVSKL